MTILGDQPGTHGHRPEQPFDPSADDPADKARRRRRRIVLITVASTIGAILLGIYVVFPAKVLRALGLRDGEYAFIYSMGGEPVTWDHCKAIRYVVNPENAPEGWEQIVSRAIADLERASGFVFADRGTTERRDLLYFANAYEPEPVLIMWSLPGEEIQLAGDTIGFAGGSPRPVGDRWRYVFGKVVMDSTASERPEGVSAERMAQLVLEHELAHVLGLDHVWDESELMYPRFQGQAGLGPGDMAGLRQLHDVPCG